MIIVILTYYGMYKITTVARLCMIMPDHTEALLRLIITSMHNNTSSVIMVIVVIMAILPIMEIVAIMVIVVIVS